MLLYLSDIVVASSFFMSSMYGEDSGTMMTNRDPTSTRANLDRGGIRWETKLPGSIDMIMLVAMSLSRHSDVAQAVDAPSRA